MTTHVEKRIKANVLYLKSLADYRQSAIRNHTIYTVIRTLKLHWTVQWFPYASQDADKRVKLCCQLLADLSGPVRRKMSAVEEKIRPLSNFPYLKAFVLWIFFTDNKSTVENKLSRINSALSVQTVLRIPIRGIHMFMGLPDPHPTPSVGDTDPDPSIIKQKQ